MIRRGKNTNNGRDFAITEANISWKASVSANLLRIVAVGLA